MRSTNKVTLVDTVHGTNLTALAAGGTLIVVYSSEIVNNVYCVVRTCLLALTAGDTSVETYLTRSSTLIVIRALHNYADGIFDQIYKSVRAGAYAQTAADTLTLIDDGNAALGDLYGVTRTDVRAVAVTETAVCTLSVTLVHHVRRAAGARTVIDKFLGIIVTRPITCDVCNKLDNVLCLNAEDSGNLLRRAVTAGSTEVGFIRLTLCERLRIAITTGEATRAAVRTRKALAYC